MGVGGGWGFGPENLSSGARGWFWGSGSCLGIRRGGVCGGGRCHAESGGGDLLGLVSIRLDAQDSGIDMGGSGAKLEGVGCAEIAVLPSALEMKESRSETALAGLKPGAEVSGASWCAMASASASFMWTSGGTRENSFFACITADRDRDQGFGAWHAEARAMGAAQVRIVARCAEPLE